MNEITPTLSQIRMLATLKGQEWLIRSDAVRDYALSSVDAAERSSQEERADSYWSQFYTLRKAAFIDQDGIGHVEVRGVLMNKAPTLYEQLGLVTRYGTKGSTCRQYRFAMASRALALTGSSPGPASSSLRRPR